MDRIERITYYENILNEATQIIRRCETAEEEYMDARDEYQDIRDEYLDARREFLAAQNEYRAALREYLSARDMYIAVQGRIAELERYYSSREWMDDFEASERGELPKGLRCGVLSEDGIDDLLDDNRELMREEELSGEDDVSPVTLQDSDDDRALIQEEEPSGDDDVSPVTLQGSPDDRTLMQKVELSGDDACIHCGALPEADI